MIQKTQAEKDALKAAKKAHKEGVKTREIEHEVRMEEVRKEKEAFSQFNKTGIKEGEYILSDDYPVYWGYTYVIDHEGGKVVTSNIQGTVKRLKDYLLAKGYKFESVYNCNFAARL
jgi:hypothetical protein